MHDSGSSMKFKSSLIVPITAAVTTGGVVDCNGYETAVAVVSSTPSGAGTTSTWKLRDGALANGSDQADVPNAAFAAIDTTGGAKTLVMNINLAKRKRYLSLVHTGVGASAAGNASGMIVLTGGRYQPAANDGTAINVTLARTPEEEAQAQEETAEAVAEAAAKEEEEAKAKAEAEAAEAEAQQPA